METLLEIALDNGATARVSMTDRSDGNLSSNLDPADVDPVRSSLHPQPWTWLRQVHGPDVVVVEAAGGGAGASADAAVTDVIGAVLAVQVADCVPVAFIGASGVVGVAHAGWKGLAAGVLAETVQALRRLGGGELCAVVGPSIGPECYEFGEPELTQLASQFGDDVRALTGDGRPAMNMAVGVRAALEAEGVTRLTWANPCTSCDADRFWSWRARTEMERQAMLVAMVETEKMVAS